MTELNDVDRGFNDITQVVPTTGIWLLGAWGLPQAMDDTVDDRAISDDSIRSSQLQHNPQLFRLLSTMPHIALLLVFVSFLAVNDSFKLFGMPRFLPKASAPVASSVTGQDLSKVTVHVRTLEPIGLPQARELQNITDRDFNEQILETSGLAIVLFTRYITRKNLTIFHR